MSKAARTDPRFDNNIDFLRLLAAVGVVFGHAFVFAGGVDPITQAITSMGFPHMDAIHGISVWFLFFISGYLVSASYAYRHDPKDYLWSRFLRIYPGLFLVILLTTLCGVFITTLSAGDYFTDKTTWKYFTRNILGFSIKYELPGVFMNNHSTAVNGSLWTIPLELRLYLVVLVLGLCGLFKRLRLLAVILFVCILCQIAYQDFNNTSGIKIGAGPVALFLIGSLFFTIRDKLSQRWIWLAVGIAAWFPFRHVPVAGHALLLFSFCYAFHLITKIPRIRLLDVGRSGDYSYGVYLWSAPIQQTLVWSGIKSSWAVFVISLVLSLIAGIASWHLVEKRALNIKKRKNE
jgi:peptidoglycan/LPS O-acetylase OafA/YrhL